MAKKATTTDKRANKDHTVVRANINREMAPGSSFVSLYVNDTQVQVSPWDIRLILGLIEGVPTAENPTVLVRQIGEIRMSPQHAKKVAQVLVNQIANYEKSVGPIVLPED